MIPKPAAIQAISFPLFVTFPGTEKGQTFLLPYPFLVLDLFCPLGWLGVLQERGHLELDASGFTFDWREEKNLKNTISSTRTAVAF